MSRAGTKVVEFIESEFAPLGLQRVVIFCGSGNNGGDGLVIGSLLKARVASVQTVRVTDGPFAETKELIAGFWLWQVKSINERKLRTKWGPKLYPRLRCDGGAA